MVFQQELPVLTVLIILVLGLIVPELFKKLRLPYVGVLILLGAVLGPTGFGYIPHSDVIHFLGFLGSAFLLLMAGLEVKLSHLENLKKKIFIMSAANGIIPMLVGIGIVKLFGYPWISALIVGIVFFSSSVAMIIPIMRAAKLDKSEIGETIVSSVVIEDMASLLLLAFVLQSFAPITDFPLPIYFSILVFSIIILKKFLPEIARQMLRKQLKKRDEDEGQLRFVIVILMAVLFYFSALGVHPIIAAFLVGLLLADVVTSKKLLSKIHTISYGLFVPIFFFSIGMGIDLKMLAQFDFRNILLITIILGLMGSKYISGYVSCRLAKFSKNNSNVFGIATTAQLTTTLAAAYAASSLGLIDTTLFTSIVIMSVFTTILSPILLSLVLQKKIS